jgi:quercetin dioxygenase-like cupin family protein
VALGALARGEGGGFGVPSRKRAQTLPSELNKAATGEVWFDPIFPKTDGVDVGTVVFSPNGRTVWHQHEHGQLLQITSGYGFVCKEGEVPQRVRAGDTVWIAPNERHWHGATSNTLMSHTTTTIGATEFHGAVTEAEYAAANTTPRA